jgi:hypothetical protein
MNIDNYKLFLSLELPIRFILTLLSTILVLKLVERPLMKWSWMTWIFLINAIDAIFRILDIKSAKHAINEGQNYLNLASIYLIINAIFVVGSFSFAFLTWRKEIRENKRLYIKTSIGKTWLWTMIVFLITAPVVACALVFLPFFFL